MKRLNRFDYLEKLSFSSCLAGCGSNKYLILSYSFLVPCRGATADIYGDLDIVQFRLSDPSSSIL